jgi:hypothetical protein
MTITINRLQAIDLLKQVSEGKENFIYKVPGGPGQNCVYLDTVTNPERPQASCLVGQALHKAGIPLDYLGWLDNLDGTETGIEDEDGYKNEYAGTGIADLDNTPALNGDTLVLTVGAVDVFDRAQRHQDQGRPWGYAVEQAIINGRGE